MAPLPASETPVGQQRASRRGGHDHGLAAEPIADLGRSHARRPVWPVRRAAVPTGSGRRGGRVPRRFVKPLAALLTL